MKTHWKICVSAALALVLCSFQVAHAATIIKLSLGSDATADYAYSGGVGGMLSTINDGNGGTPGDQDTAVEFLDFLSGFANNPAGASYTLSGPTALVPATVFAGFVFQDLNGGTFQLWDNLNQPLLSVGLTTSTVVGQVGNPSGAVITTTLGTPLGGPLAPYIVPGTVSISIALSDIKSGLVSGFTVSPTMPVMPGLGILDAFNADATKTISADWTGVPEPTSLVLIMLGALLAGASRRGRA
jgi:hypothetical protein